MNLALLLTALPVLCTPVAGSLLRFPDTSMFCFSPEVIDPGPFGAGAFERADLGLFSAWDDPPHVFDELPEIRDADVVVTTEINTETSFGPKRDLSLFPVAYIPEPIRRWPQLGVPLETAEPSDFLFLMTGFACFSMAFLIQLPRLILRRTLDVIDHHRRAGYRRFQFQPPLLARSPKARVGVIN